MLIDFREGDSGTGPSSPGIFLLVIGFLPINAVFLRQIGSLLVITPLRLSRFVVVFAPLPRFTFSNVAVLFFLLSPRLAILCSSVNFVLVVVGGAVARMAEKPGRGRPRAAAAAGFVVVVVLDVLDVVVRHAEGMAAPHVPE